MSFVKKRKLMLLLDLFLTFMKIGLFTFGGGYAMIPLIQKEASEKKGWVNSTEILDIIAISESTPGPISINSATFIGHKVAGISGAIAATLGLIIPSWVIILVISIFYNQFRSLHWIDAIFKGLKVGVIAILTLAIIKLFKAFKLKGIYLIIFCVALVIYLSLTFFLIEIPALSIILIALGLIVGIVITKVESKKEDKK